MSVGEEMKSKEVEQTENKSLFGINDEQDQCGSDEQYSLGSCAIYPSLADALKYHWPIYRGCNRRCRL